MQLCKQENESFVPIWREYKILYRSTFFIILDFTTKKFSSIFLLSLRESCTKFVTLLIAGSGWTVKYCKI